jgi:hypothetical protein
VNEKAPCLRDEVWAFGAALRFGSGGWRRGGGQCWRGRDSLRGGLDVALDCGAVAFAPTSATARASAFHRTTSIQRRGRLCR